MKANLNAMVIGVRTCSVEMRISTLGNEVNTGSGKTGEYISFFDDLL